MDTETLQLASTGLVEPEFIARRLGLSVDELLRRHGAEIRAAQAATRGECLRRVLLCGIEHRDPGAARTALEADEEDWLGVPGLDAYKRRILRGQMLHVLLVFARSGTTWRHVEACDAVLKRPDDDWLAAADALKLRFCDPHRAKVAAHNRWLVIEHLLGIYKDAEAKAVVPAQGRPPHRERAAATPTSGWVASQP